MTAFMNRAPCPLRGSRTIEGGMIINRLWYQSKHQNGYKISDQKCPIQVIRPNSPLKWPALCLVFFLTLFQGKWLNTSTLPAAAQGQATRFLGASIVCGPVHRLGMWLSLLLPLRAMASSSTTRPKGTARSSLGEISLSLAYMHRPWTSLHVN